MSTPYKAPQQEMLFVLNQLSELPQLAELPVFEDVSDDLVEAIINEASKLAEDVVAPLNWTGHLEKVKLDSDHNVHSATGFKEAFKAFSDAGWSSLAADPNYGGQGMPSLLAVPVMENWHAANMAWGLCPLLSQGSIEAISAKASDELKEKYLPKLIAGEWAGTMNLTEAQAGTDLALIKSTAKPAFDETNGQHYKIAGQKIFITWGEHDMVDNLVHLVLARLPDAPVGVKGISLFIVPKFLVNDDGSLGERNDVKAIALEEKLGIHASPTCVMSFGDNEGAIGYLVGEENQGLACMFVMMNDARLGVGLQGIGLSERAYQHACDYARQRIQSPAPGERQSSPIIKHPDVRRNLMTMRALTEAGRALTYTAFTSVDWQHHHPDNEARQYHRQRSGLLTPIVKGWCTEVAQEVTSIGIQIHGGMGFIEETKAAQFYADARILPIYEGTNGIQAMDLIGRKTLFDSGLATDALLAEIQQVIDNAKPYNSLSTMAAHLQNALNNLAESKQYILENNNSDAYFAGSVAFSYLMQSGYTCAGWKMLQSAIAATQLLGDENADSEFLNAKLITAQFYIEQLLPRHLGYAQSIKAGSSATMALDEINF